MWYVIRTARGYYDDNKKDWVKDKGMASLFILYHAACVASKMVKAKYGAWVEPYAPPVRMSEYKIKKGVTKYIIRNKRGYFKNYKEFVTDINDASQFSLDEIIRIAGNFEYAYKDQMFVQAWIEPFNPPVNVEPGPQPAKQEAVQEASIDMATMTPEEAYRYGIEEERSRALGVLEVLAADIDLPKIFTVFKDGEIFAVPPDRIGGVFEAILDKYQQSYDWSLLKEKENEKRKLQSNLNEIAQELGLSGFPTITEMIERIQQIKDSNRVDQIEAENKKIRESLDKICYRLSLPPYPATDHLVEAIIDRIRYLKSGK